MAPVLTFTVHEPPNPPADRIERAERLAFVKDGFTWSAALFAPLWMIVHRLWWVLLAYVVLGGAVEAAQSLLDFNAGWVTLFAVALNILIGFEASGLRQWELDRKGWHSLGSVSGRNLAECERRFFEGWLPAQPLVTAPPPRSQPPRKWPVIGSLLGANS
jgi:hypothetical protein